MGVLIYVILKETFHLDEIYIKWTLEHIFDIYAKIHEK